jgi:CheY-like chemotaxis protein
MKSARAVVKPKVLDVNDAVAGMLKLLRRLIGEDVNLGWQPGANLHPVRIDPSQVDQILANLCLNARDAIGGAGRITMQTQNINITAEYCMKHIDALPGAYVCLTVSDDGCGMNPETMAQIFEPFFTTKGMGMGKGTGLGLATVYGIVKQNNGFICVDSESGKGATFRIHLPQVSAEVAAKTVLRKEDLPQSRGETVLLVEDEHSLRRVCSLFLRTYGYNVLEAETPGEALALISRTPSEIHLLLTDVVLPGMDGQQLAQRINAVKPGIKVLFMSGYTADVIAERGVLEQNIAFIAKPFTRDDLARKVRDVLGSAGSIHL